MTLFQRAAKDSMKSVLLESIEKVLSQQQGKRILFFQKNANFAPIFCIFRKRRNALIEQEKDCPHVYEEF